MSKFKIKALKEVTLKKIGEGKLILKENLKAVNKIIRDKEIKIKVEKATKDISTYTAKKLDELKKNKKVRKVINDVSCYANDNIDKLKKNEKMKKIKEKIIRYTNKQI